LGLRANQERMARMKIMKASALQINETESMKAFI